MAFYPPIYGRNFYGVQNQPEYHYPQNDMLWVLNEGEAAAYPVTPNNSVVLWDKNSPTIYVKSVNMQGVPSLRVLDFTERVAEPQKQPVQHECACGKEFAPLDAFNRLQGEFEAFMERYEKESKPKTKKEDKE